MPPLQRREAIVAAAIEVAVAKGLASTTVRDVAAAMGTSSGLIHHYFGSMDEVLAAAFEHVAQQDLELSARLMAEAGDPVEAIRVFFRTYTPADKDWAFQLWLDAWAEAARRPAIQATSRRLNLEWQGLLERTIREGVAVGVVHLRGSGRGGVADPVAARRTGAPGRGPRDDDLARGRGGVGDRGGGRGAGAGRGRPRGLNRSVLPRILPDDTHPVVRQRIRGV